MTDDKLIHHLIEAGSNSNMHGFCREMKMEHAMIAAERIRELRGLLAYAHHCLWEAMLFKGYIGGPLDAPFAKMIEKQIRAALAGEKKDDG